MKRPLPKPRAIAAGWADYLDDIDEREMAFMCEWGEPGCPRAPETLAHWRVGA